MSIASMVSGKLNRDAEIKQSQKGTSYALLIIRLEAGDFVRCNLFGDDHEAAARLKRGDDVSVVGRLEVGTWERDGKPAPSLSMMASRCISPVM